MEQDLSRYKLVIAPMLYMLRPGVDERIVDFVAAGGTFVATYWTGIVDENDLVILGGWPGSKLREVLGIWDEEIDALYENDRNAMVFDTGNPLGLGREYELRDYCALVHPEGAEVLATYRDDFYAGRPALTANAFGDGMAYYLASNPDAHFLADFYGALDANLGLLHSLDAELPHGVSAQLRTDGETKYVFLMNFNAEPVVIDLGTAIYTDLLTGDALSGVTELDVYDVKVLAA
jgi:beta-galactosidase